jgi:predicted DsbA family dithiol-disulfide isomerase
MERGRLTIIAYSDYVCPWCYIGLLRVDRLQQEHPVEVEWRPFELHPETPRDGAQLAGRLGSSARAAAYANNILNLARESGLAMRMPAVVANSHLALEAGEFAHEHGGFEAYRRALFRAYFEEARDIGNSEVLCEVARACGVDDQGLRQALVDSTYAEQVDQITEPARANEIVSTPTFIFEGGFRLVGGQDYDVFASVTSRLLGRLSRQDASKFEA